MAATATKSRKKATKKTVKRVVKKKAPAKKSVSVLVTKVLQKFTKIYVIKRTDVGVALTHEDCRSFKAAVDMKNKVSPLLTPLDLRCSSLNWNGKTCVVKFEIKS